MSTVEDINRGYKNSADIVEQTAFRIYDARTGELPQRVAELQLVIEHKRAQAAERLADLILAKLPASHPSVERVEIALNEFLAEELTHDIYSPGPDAA